MAGKIRKMFPGGNTSNGFYSFFGYIIPDDVNRIFCLKGGPGVGKSSFMKKVAREFVKMGYDIELHYCSSDPKSLDGVVINGLNVVLLDATAPHIVDPKLPGAVDEIINFGEFWDVEKLEKNKSEIKLCNDNIGDCFQRAFKFLKSAEPIYLDIESKNSKCMDWSKVNKATDDFMDKLFYGVEFCEEIPKCRHLFGSAITPVGYLDYSDSLFEGVENIYYLSGDIGVGKSEFLRSIYNRALKKGLDVEILLTAGADKVTAAVLSGDVNIGFCGSEATIYIYNQGEKDYLVNFAGLTKRDGSFIVSRKKIENFTLNDMKGKYVIGGRKGYLN